MYTIKNLCIFEKKDRTICKKKTCATLYAKTKRREVLLM